MPNVKITDLPAAQPLTGTEIVPMVQGGITVRATTAAIAASPSLTQTFLTLNQEPTLSNSRRLSGGSGIGLVDGGAQAALQITLNGTSGSLESAGDGLISKVGYGSVIARSIASSGSGLSVSDGDGVSGNPTISLTGIAAAVAGLSGTGLMSIKNSSTVGSVQILNTDGNISVLNGNGLSGDPTINLTTTGASAGSYGSSTAIPVLSVDAYGRITSISTQPAISGGTVTQINTGTGLTGGPITTSGTIDIASTGVTAGTYGSSTLIPQIVVNAQGQITSVTEESVVGGVSSVNGQTGDVVLDYADVGAPSTSGTDATGTWGIDISGNAATATSATSATTATTSTNIAGGATGSIPYQSSVDTTIFLAAGSNNQIIRLVGGVPTWSNESPDGVTSVDVSGGTTGLTTSGGPITSSGTITFGGILNSASGGTGVNNGSSTITIAGNIVTAGDFTTSGAYGLTLTATGITNVTLPTAGTLSTLAGTETLTNKTISGADNTLSNIGNSSLTNSSITINGSSVSLGGSVTVTATASNALTIGTGLSGTSYDGSAPVTIAIDSTVATLTGIQTLTNKSMSGSSNTFTDIPNGALTNSSVTFNGTSVALGASGTITAVNPFALTIGTGLSGSSYDGAGAVTIDISNTGVTAASYGSASKTLTATVNAQGQLTALADTDIAISYTQVSGLGTAAVLNAGSANGVASLDSGGTVPLSQLPSSIQGGLNYQGTWNASTNTPTLASGTGTKGYFYIVSVAGSTNLDGITDWQVGDWAVYSGTAWGKVDNTDAVTSVNGYTGTVVLSYTDVGAPSTTGTNATGTWGIDISGNSATVTNGVYTTGSYANPAWITSLAASKITGTLAVANGGTGLSSYSVGDIVYASGASTLAGLGIGSNTYILTSSGSAPQWSNPAGITVGSATNATNATNAVNTGITSDSTNATRYLTFVSATTGNVPQLVNSSITVNPSTGAVTGGIAGGTF